MQDEALNETVEIVVDRNQSPIRIDVFLMGKLEKITRNKLQDHIRSGQILVDGKEVKPNLKIKPNQLITVSIPRTKSGELTITPQDLNIDVRYEDDDILVVHKAPGMVVHPGFGNPDGTLVNGVAYHLRNNPDMPLLPGNGADRPGLVHRIDKDTSGLLVLAKTDFAMAHLAKQFFDHTIDRTYHALVWGDPDEDEGTIIGNIGRHPVNRMWMTVFPEGDEGKHAVTHYKVLKRFYYVTLLECKLETGRTHQIRVHLKHIGHTLFNDIRYGGNSILKGTVFTKYKQFVNNAFALIPRTALHAKSLGFIHPRTNEKMVFDSELPEDLQNCLEKWNAYAETKKSQK